MKCSELAKEYGILPMRVGKIRSKKFPDSRGQEMNDNEVAYVRGELERQLPTDGSADLVKPEIVNAVVTHLGGTQRLVECMVRGEAGRFAVLLPFGMSKDRLRLQQTLQVERIEYEGRKYYRHASLARKDWEFDNKRKPRPDS